jgi:hypothetical protein
MKQARASLARSARVEAGDAEDGQGSTQCDTRTLRRNRECSATLVFKVPRPRVVLSTVLRNLLAFETSGDETGFLSGSLPHAEAVADPSAEARLRRGAALWTGRDEGDPPPGWRMMKNPLPLSGS